MFPIQPYLLFVVSISLASETFNKVCRVLVVASYDQYVTLPKRNEKWESEVKGFIENYQFPFGTTKGFGIAVLVLQEARMIPECFLLHHYMRRLFQETYQTKELH